MVPLQTLVRVFLPLLAAVVLFAMGDNVRAETNVWTFTGILSAVRTNDTATLLPNGKVLVAGGDTVGGATTEIYDPTAGTWSTTGSMNQGRSKHTATLLPNGKVLVAGGDTVGGATAEIYDPSAGSWSTTGSMHQGRFSFTATLLPNGKVLVAGGHDSNGTLQNSAETYDPATGIWNTTGSMSVPRIAHTATLLPNGKLLVAGGYGRFSCVISMRIVMVGEPYILIAQLNTDAAELYDPATGIWTTTGSMSVPRSAHTATLLPNGKVLVAGGGDLEQESYATQVATYDHHQNPSKR